MQHERPRIRAEGPGGPEVKQGARIACLDCRSAKIRCSAPTDGNVPCKRCSRHGKECVFEKHRRGRKPGRTITTLKGASTSLARSRNLSGESSRITIRRQLGPSFMKGVEGYETQPDTQAHPNYHQHQNHHGEPDHSVYLETQPSRHSAHLQAAWLPPSDLQRLPSTSYSRGKPASFESLGESQTRHHLTSDRGAYHQSPVMSPPQGHGSNSLRWSGTGDPSSYSLHMSSATPSFSSSPGASKDKSPHISLPPPQLPIPRLGGGDHPTTPGGGLLAHLSGVSVGPPTFSSRSWLELPSPLGRSLISPSNILGGSSGGGTSAWPGGVTLSPQKRKFAGDYFSGPISEGGSPGKMHMRTSSSTAMEESQNGKEVRNIVASRGLAQGMNTRRAQHFPVETRSEGHRRTTSGYSNVSEEYEEEAEIDQLDEDEVGGGHNDDVLSTPLRLLAHASDAAEALKGGSRNLLSSRVGLRDAADRPNNRLGTGAVTMGLVSPSAPRLGPPGRWQHSVRLPNLVEPRFQQRDGRQLPTLYPSVGPKGPGASYSEGRLAGLMGPPFSRFAKGDSATHNGHHPHSLGSIGRSRSYTAVEKLAKSEPISIVEKVEEAAHGPTRVTAVERRAEVLGIGTRSDGTPFDVAPSSISTSTLDPGSWEYRNGRARTRKGANSSSGARTSSSAEVQMGGEEEDPSKSKSSKLSLLRRSSSTSKPSESVDATKKPIPRRWVATKRRVKGDAESEGESEHSEEIGASHKDFFALSLYHSKMDNDDDLDPVQEGLLELKELEKLFDVFFGRINPLLNIFDPFLHSVAYVRNRSALLTTVIAALAARLRDTPRDAELAVLLEEFWRERLLPEVLLGGYKSVELSQAFLVLSLYHKPTNRLADDRSWQYLGFAIRIATEVGVNRKTTPDASVKDNEQVRRRMRNRSRLWINLFLSDRALSAQTGRPHTISEDALISHSSLWHREDFALPEDVILVGLTKLRRLVGEHTDAFDAYLAQSGTGILDLDASGKVTAATARERMAGFEYWRMKSNSDLGRWKETWCVETIDEAGGSMQSLSMGAVLVRWRPHALMYYLHARLRLNSLVLQEMEKWRAFLHSQGTPLQAPAEDEKDMVTPVAHECWQSATSMIDVLLRDIDEEQLAAAPNQTAIVSTWSALAALRLTKSGHNTSHPWADREAILEKSRRLAEALMKAGRVPAHRNGSATPYGVYLSGIVALWERPLSLSSASSTTDAEIQITGKSGVEGEGDAPEQISSSFDSKKPKGPEGHLSEEKEPKSSLKADSIQRIPHTSQVVDPIDNIAATAAIAATVKPPETPQLHSVGHELWGANSNNQGVSADPTTMDRMWDYLTTYPEPSSGFPLSLWQPQPVWSGVLNHSSASATAANTNATTTTAGAGQTPSSSTTTAT